LDIIKYDIYRGPNIGIFINVNDKFVFIPNGFAKTKAENLARYLQTECITTPVANTRLLGVLMVLNNHGILLPRTSSPEEIANLRKQTDLNVKILDTKYNALGNLICANDKGGIVSPVIEKEHIKEIEDVLDIEVMQKKVAGYYQVGAAGSLAYAQAFERGTKIVGVTSHYVTENLDQGPIIFQDSFKVTPEDTLESIKKRGQKLEASTLLKAVKMHLDNKLEVRWRKVHTKSK